MYLTRNQAYRKVPWVRIPPLPPIPARVCRYEDSSKPFLFGVACGQSVGKLPESSANRTPAPSSFSNVSWQPAPALNLFRDGHGIGGQSVQQVPVSVVVVAWCQQVNRRCAGSVTVAVGLDSAFNYSRLKWKYSESLQLVTLNRCPSLRESTRARWSSSCWCRFCCR
jgi:hypothetical protein